MPIKPEYRYELLSGYEKAEDLLGEEELFKQLKRALLERAPGAELTHHLTKEAQSRSTCRAIATAPSSRRSCPRARHAVTASTARSSRSAPAV